MGAVRVLDCNGSGWVSDMISGLDWVLQNAQRPTVVHFGGGTDTPNQVLDAAILNVIAQGIPVIASAGNYQEGDALPCLNMLSWQDRSRYTLALGCFLSTHPDSAELHLC